MLKFNDFTYYGGVLFFKIMYYRIAKGYFTLRNVVYPPLYEF